MCVSCCGCENVTFFFFTARDNSHIAVSKSDDVRPENPSQVHVSRFPPLSLSLFLSRSASTGCRHGHGQRATSRVIADEVSDRTTHTYVHVNTNTHTLTHVREYPSRMNEIFNPDPQYREYLFSFSFFLFFYTHSHIFSSSLWFWLATNQ